MQGAVGVPCVPVVREVALVLLLPCLASLLHREPSDSHRFALRRPRVGKPRPKRKRYHGLMECEQRDPRDARLRRSTGWRSVLGWLLWQLLHPSRRRNQHTRWVVFQQGGGWCTSDESCDARVNNCLGSSRYGYSYSWG